MTAGRKKHLAAISFDTARAEASTPAAHAGVSSRAPRAPPCIKRGFPRPIAAGHLAHRLLLKGRLCPQDRRDAGLTYKVAWDLGHRIRAMMSERHITLGGVGEIDEIYAGAPPRRPHGGGPSGVPSGRGLRRPLDLTMVERGGRVVLERIKSHSSQAIGAATSPRIDPGAIIATDALPAYKRVANGHTHLTVTHSAGEYVVRNPAGIGVDAHTNTAESVHGLIRRAVVGVWHWISQAHLDRYLAELGWRHNRRHEGHLSRIADLLISGGRPLPLGELIATKIL